MNCDPARPASGPVAPHAARAEQRAFTMVEIALCLGVIAFALVAIIGVMPTGLRVQQENRDDTIVNQDATFWVEAIRSGWWGIDPDDHLPNPDLTNFVFGLNSLTNHVLAIAVSNRLDGTRIYTQPVLVRGMSTPLFGRVTVNPGSTRIYPTLTNGITIVGLLSRPKWELRNGVWETNYVAALVRSISGAAIEKAGAGTEMAFTYLLTSEVIPMGINPAFYPREWTNFTGVVLSTVEYAERSNRWARVQNLAPNCSELRLVLHGPAVPGPGASWMTLGRAKTFRTIVNGRQYPSPRESPVAEMRFVQPGSFRREGP